MKVEIYSDVACPWCYIGKKRFEKALGQFAGREDVEVVLRPFQLDPTLSPDPAKAVPSREHYLRKFGPQFPQMEARVVAMAKEEGITYDAEKILATNTRQAHRLMWLANEVGGPELQLKMAERIFKAYFTDGRNVADPADLVELAVEVGLDRERVTAFLASDEGQSELDAQLQGAHERGISSVPTFVFEDRWAVAGAQDPAAFLQALEAIAAETGTKAGTTPADGCDDGACAI